ncbi:UvrABC system protein B, partial [Haemophilus influenzae]
KSRGNSQSITSIA